MVRVHGMESVYLNCRNIIHRKAVLMQACPDCDSFMIYVGAEIEQDEDREIMVDVYECTNCHTQITWGPLDRAIDEMMDSLEE